MTGDFSGLDPHAALEAVEEAFGVRPDGSFYPYPSYVNRVYGFRADDGREYVAKFYRPGRWTPDAIRDEHDFVLALRDADVPVVPPLPDLEGDTLPFLALGDEGPELPFALFEKRGGRSFDADGPDDLLRLGSLAGRIHAVGSALAAAGRCGHRPRMEPGLLASHAAVLAPLVPPELRDEFGALMSKGAELTDRVLDGRTAIILHGDFHRGNILDRVDQGLLAIDFDDSCLGPPVQDLWMLLPGTAAQSPRELEAAIRGYDTFASFDPAWLGMIEALRLLRMTHYLAWQARQLRDAGFQTHFPAWGTRAFWERELSDIQNQLDSAGA
ncbi:MAG: serine/threonine protein kinase [Spirochaetales bacterium]|nr:serine/threonine protein kinase [Spirochaetales bacterium]MBP7264366.1 serine/threonine protein kinase [Spirochaetia bacterium]